MAGVSRVVIHESVEQLQALMHGQSSAKHKERLHLLYLLKSGAAESVSHAAILLSRGRITLQRWLRDYKTGGIVGLLNIQTPPGQPCKIPLKAQAALIEKLDTTQGFGSYGEIQDWLWKEYQHQISYSGIHKHVRYQLQAKPKRPRPLSQQQDAVKVAFFKTT